MKTLSKIGLPLKGLNRITHEILRHFRDSRSERAIKIDIREKVFYHSRELLTGEVAERLKAAVSKTV